MRIALRLPIFPRSTKKAGGEKAAGGKPPATKGIKKKAGTGDKLLSGLSTKPKKKKGSAETTLAKVALGRTVSRVLVSVKLLIYLHVLFTTFESHRGAPFI